MTSRNIQSNQEKLNLNGDGIDYPLQYSCLGNPMEEESGRLQSTRSQKSPTRLNNSTTKENQFNLFKVILIFLI